MVGQGRALPAGENQRLINNTNGPIGALIVRVVPDDRVIPDKFPGHRLVKLAAMRSCSWLIFSAGSGSGRCRSRCSDGVESWLILKRFGLPSVPA